jgi:hypothetical protein
MSASLGENHIEITVTFDHGGLVFSPDPAIVRRGEAVSWRFQASTLPASPLQWTVYFNKGSPFHAQDHSHIHQFTARTPSVGRQQIATSQAMSADDPGEYKYGVRVVDAINQTTLGDDDPWLIVL